MSRTKYTYEPIKVPRFEEANGFYTSPQRSGMMKTIKGKNTRPEILFRKALWHAGVKYRIHSKQLLGRPDISIQSKKLVIFIDGSFWHGYNWEEKKDKIKSNKAFWIPKIERNIQRDAEVNAYYHDAGYTVFRFWDFEIKNQLGACLQKVLEHWEASYRYR